MNIFMDFIYNSFKKNITIYLVDPLDCHYYLKLLFSKNINLLIFVFSLKFNN